MPLRLEEVRDLFDRARAEMFVEPVALNAEVWDGPFQFEVREGKVAARIPARLLRDPEGGPIILWYFRHNLAHMHYCPYNLKTVQTLARAAYEEARSWAHAHNAVRLFADLQVDLFYLPLKYKRAPLHLADEFASKPSSLEALRYAAYKHVYGELLREHRLDRDVAFYGSLLAEVVLSPRPWVSKVRVVASVLKRLQSLEKVKRLKPRAGEGVPLFEDMERDFLAEARRVMGWLSKEEARELYKHWLKERIDLKGLEEELKEALKGAGKEGKLEELKQEAASRGEGEEPELPSTLSKPATKVGDIDELVWKALWYRAKAEDILMTYGGGLRRGGTWAIYAYSDLWTVEDDLEELDLEATFEEGPLVPEETTLKDVTRPSPSGEVLIQEKTPTVLVVLDTSRSMQGVLDEAAIAAFAAYLNAKRQGGKVSVINFSTRYVAVGWREPDFKKELVLAASQGELTILPLSAIKRLLGELEPGESATVIIVTDCGWQNLREAILFLENLASRGHQIAVFHVEGWKYPRSVEAVSKARGLTLYRVGDPTMLKYLALREHAQATQEFSQAA
ncbi:MAG: hypothetical protein LM580_08080 [Thermofilum sp.]|nr:hypothetical protein [Thermofilum sp.]